MNVYGSHSLMLGSQTKEAERKERTSIRKNNLFNQNNQFHKFSSVPYNIKNMCHLSLAVRAANSTRRKPSASAALWAASAKSSRSLQAARRLQRSVEARRPARAVGEGLAQEFFFKEAYLKKRSKFLIYGRNSVRSHESWDVFRSAIQKLRKGDRF